MRDNIDGLLHDTFRDVAGDLGLEGVREGLSEDTNKFYKLLRKENKSYYLGVRIFRNLISPFDYSCSNAIMV